MDRVYELGERVKVVRSSASLACELDPVGSIVRIEGLRYTRGSLEVTIPRLILQPGRIYAVTGANGAGKSSLFGVLAHCGALRTQVPDGLQVHQLDALVMPSDDVVEIT